MMSTAIVLHAVWDDLGGLLGSHQSLLPLALLTMVLISIAAVFVVFHITVAAERDYMRDVMAPEVDRGVLTDAELHALCGDRKDRKAYRRAGRRRHERKQAKLVLGASSDLANAIAHDRGADTPKVEFTRSEVQRLRNRGNAGARPRQA